MSNPLTTPQFVPPLRPMTELYNIGHERPFSILFANYSWALGIAGGLALLWAINAWRGNHDRVEHRFTLPLAAALIIGGFVNVLAEVRQPGRLIYGYYLGWYNWDTAIIKYGIILLPVFLALTWWLSFQSMPRERLAAEVAGLTAPWRQLADILSLWSRFYSLFDSRFLTRVVLVAMAFLGLFGPLYSAVFLMNEHGVPVWNSPAEAMLFLASGIGVAAAMMLGLVPLLGWMASGQWLTPRPYHRWTAVIAFTLCGTVWYGWMWWIGRFGTIEDLRAANLFMGPVRGRDFLELELRRADRADRGADHSPRQVGAGADGGLHRRHLGQLYRPHRHRARRRSDQPQRRRLPHLPHRLRGVLVHRRQPATGRRLPRRAARRHPAQPCPLSQGIGSCWNVVAFSPFVPPPVSVSALRVLPSAWWR